MMSARVIVLGAGGFMGRAVWRALAEDPACNHLAVHFRRPPAPAIADTQSRYVARARSRRSHCGPGSST